LYPKSSPRRYPGLDGSLTLPRLISLLEFILMWGWSPP
jgi:hypothetical protein